MNKKEDRTMAMKLSYKSGDTLTITYTLQGTTNKHPKSARAQRVTVT